MVIITTTKLQQETIYAHNCVNSGSINSSVVDSSDMFTLQPKIYKTYYI